MFRGDKFVTPLYRILDNDVPEQGASGTWLSVGSMKFLVTAAHAVNEGYVWFPKKQRGFKKLESPSVKTTGKDDDTGDLCIFTLSPNDISEKHPFHEYVAIEQVDVNLNYRFGSRYEFTGYPYVREDLDHISKTSDPGYTAVISESVSEKKFKKLQLSTHSHAVVAFYKRMLSDGKKIDAPDPKGMSGGAVWKHYSDSTERKLAAIAIACRNQALIGTRISLALEYIKSRYPHVARLIPTPTDVIITSE